MNGLEIMTPEAPSLIRRLLRRPPRRSFPLELNNYVASTPLSDVTRGQVERLASECGCPAEEVREARAHVYARVLAHLAQDGKVSDEEAEQLVRLRDALGLSPEEVREAEAQVLLPIYREKLRQSLSDRHLTPAEGEGLKRLAGDLRLDEASTDQVDMSETFRAFADAPGEGPEEGKK